MVKKAIAKLKVKKKYLSSLVFFLKSIVDVDIMMMPIPISSLKKLVRIEDMARKTERKGFSFSRYQKIIYIQKIVNIG